MSLTKVSYSMINGSSVNVVDYGMATTASAAANKTALLAAITAAGQGGCVNIPNGTFNIDGDIQVNVVGVTIVGAASNYRYNVDSGFTGTELKFMSGNAGFDLSQLYGSAANSEFSVLRNLNINGNSILSTGVYIYGCKLIQNCTVQLCLTAGITLASYTNATVIEECGLVGNSIGLYVTGVANTVFLISKCNIRQNFKGVQIEEDVGGKFEQCVIETNKSWGLLITVPAAKTVGDITLNKCWFENNGYDVPIQQVRFQSDLPNADLYNISFKDCTFDTLNNTTRQDIYLDAGVNTKFSRCKFTGYLGVATGIVINNTASYTSFIGCTRGVVFGQEFNYITNNGVATYVQPLGQTYVGSNLLESATWTNVNYGTFTSTGNKVTSAISSGGAKSATLSTITRYKGVSYVMQFILVVNSGEKPTLTLTNGNNTANLFSYPVTAQNVERVYYTETITGNSGVLTVTNSAASNWYLLVNLIEYETARGWIDPNAG